MVSVTTAVLAVVFGMMLYFMVPVLSNVAPVEIRQTVGTFYLKLGAKCLKQFTFVRRVLSGYDILPISVDDEQKLLQVTLSGSTLGEDTQYRFADPDNRIKRLFNKPVALAFELVPSAIDASMAEWGHWANEKENNEGDCCLPPLFGILPAHSSASTGVSLAIHRPDDSALSTLSASVRNRDCPRLSAQTTARNRSRVIAPPRCEAPRPPPKTPCWRGTLSGSG